MFACLCLVVCFLYLFIFCIWGFFCNWLFFLYLFSVFCYFFLYLVFCLFESICCSCSVLNSNRVEFVKSDWTFNQMSSQIQAPPACIWEDKYRPPQPVFGMLIKKHIFCFFTNPFMMIFWINADRLNYLTDSFCPLSLVSSIQAVMASSAGCIITSSCRDIMEDRWGLHLSFLSYLLFVIPYLSSLLFL